MDEVTKDDPPLSLEQLARVEVLSEADLQVIDETLLGNASTFWRKVARVVGSTIADLKENYEGIPDVFYAQRVQALVKNGLLESQGNLKRMRFSEVKLPGGENETTS